MDAVNDSSAQKAATTYNAAADHFDDAPLAFWDRHGRRAIELAALEFGERVLDVGCGTGASAIPAAKAVGPGGQVIGLDVAEGMLARAQQKAAALDLDNIEFRHADMSDSGEPDESFDAVISVFSVFFVPGMEQQIAELWRQVRKNGRLVVTVWAERSFEPAVPIFYEEMRRLRPNLKVAPRPWERLTVPNGLRRLLLDGGTREPEILCASDYQSLASPEDWWTICIGSGFRGEIDQLNKGEQNVLKARIFKRLWDEEIHKVETSALHAVVYK